MSAYKLKRRLDAAAERRIHKRQAGAVLGIAGVYCGTVAITVLFTELFSLPLFEGEGAQARPSAWLWFVWFVYYALPVVLAVITATAIRPFWATFRNVLLVIAAAHGMYSAACFGLRETYLEETKNELKKSREGYIRIFEKSLRKHDDNSDGLTEKITLRFSFDGSPLHLGEYTLRVFASQSGDMLPQGEIGRYEFTIGGGQKVFYTVFDFDPQRFKGFFSRGEISLDAELRRMMPVSLTAKKVIALCRWAAFYRPVTWGGFDPDISERELVIESIEKIESFYFLPLQLPGSGRVPARG